MSLYETSSAPLVAVLIPVYNGEEYLRECIESVLAQTYSNWECVIVNNCSTDRTLEIAQEYAASDRRIRVHSNQHFAPIIQNHNIALRRASLQSKYCKVVFADDWLFPQCLMEMVKVAEAHPSAGIVGAYGLDSTEVLWSGLPYPSTFVSGRKLCRETLLGGPYVFGTPTSLLIRSDLVRAQESFYNESNLHADHEACYEVLRDSDFGFVHQVLTFSRPRPESTAVVARRLESYILGSLSALVIHGPIYLTRDEYELRLEQRMNQYYKVLAKNFLRLREKKFWEYHREKLANLGHPLSHIRLSKAVLREVLESLSRPLDALDGVRSWWPRTFSRMLNK
jgi:glycosyltransferase involved in cell wall biosynthesis